jgi:hypothetical protein
MMRAASSFEYRPDINEKDGGNVANEKMTPYFAVFNNHINDAKERALSVLDEYFPSWAEEIRAVDKTGIMEIVQKEPTPATASFTALVTMFVNGDDIV